MLTSPQGSGSERVHGVRSEKSSRITEVDVLRGFALLGISLANTVSITGMPTGEDEPSASYWAFETLLHQRFFPIFSFLFGVSFGLFLDAAQDRTRHSRLAMLARLGFLILFGALHRILQPDEVLLSYGVVGILALLPVSFLPGRMVAVLGVLGVAAGLAAGGGSLLIPGLFMLGLGAQRYDLPKALDGRRSHLAVVFGAVFSLALCLNVWQVTNGPDSGAQLAATAGVVTAGAYVLGILLLHRTCARWMLRQLAPVGRMALTGYITGTVMTIAAGKLITFEEAPKYKWAVFVGLCVFMIELVFSWVWLQRARHGPLEWIWRCLTWWHLEPNSKSGRM